MFRCALVLLACVCVCVRVVGQHDLSLLSGIACAVALGGSHPFSTDYLAAFDFKKLRSLLSL